MSEEREMNDKATDEPRRAAPEAVPGEDPADATIEAGAESSPAVPAASLAQELTEELTDEQAVFERWEEGLEETLFAVLLVGDAEEELVLPAHRLPRGVRTGDWLRLTRSGDRVVGLTVDEETTTTRRTRIQSKRAVLKARPRKLKPRGES